jgi:hypothetical protein
VPETIPTFIARKWALHEVSLVPVAADLNARLRAADPSLPEKLQPEMRYRSMTVAPAPNGADNTGGQAAPAPAVSYQSSPTDDPVARERARCDAIHQAAEGFGAPASMTRALINSGATAERAIAEMTDFRARSPMNAPVRGVFTDLTVRGGFDPNDPAAMRRAIVGAVAYRLSNGSVKATGEAEAYNGVPLYEMQRSWDRAVQGGYGRMGGLHLQRLPARLIGIGVRPEHVASSAAG